MSEKVIIVRRKKKKDKGKKKRKTKPKSTMEQKVTQNVKVIINERARPRRNRALAVKGFNTPRLSIQPPTIIHKGLDAESALNSFRNIYDTRVRALERGLNGVNGNITNLTSQLQNNRPPPLNTPQPSGTTPFISDEEGQRILDQRLAQRIEQEQQEQYNTLKKDFYNDQLGEQDQVFENFINPLPVAESRLAPAQNIEVEKAEAIKPRQKFTREERAVRKVIRREERGSRSLEYTEAEIRDATADELQGMILSLGEEEGDKYFDNFGGIKKGQIGNARNYVRNVVKRSRQERLQGRSDVSRGGKNLKVDDHRNL